MNHFGETFLPATGFSFDENGYRRVLRKTVNALATASLMAGL